MIESTSKQLGVPVPSILLEGDEPSLPQATGPGRKFASGPSLVTGPAESIEAALPEAYGTGRLWLVSRDPHCLYAHWDLTAQQQRECNTQSVHQHLLVRVYQDHSNGRPLNEIHVHPESRHWFIHVERAGATYIAELGFYPKDGHWQRVALSEPVSTPAATRAEPGPVQFATMTFESPAVFRAGPEPSPGTYFHRSATGPSGAAQGAFHARSSVTEVRPTGAYHASPAWLPSTAPPWEWSEAQTQIVAEMSGWTMARTEWLDSMEITRLVEGKVEILPRAELGAEALLPSSLEAAIFSPAPGPPGEVSSPFGGEVPAQKQFWFNVNAELVIYGATEPDAQVTIGGRPIRLRPDGTFSYRFALPDGTYELPIAATAAHGDSRLAHLRFHRGTSYSGEVGVHPQDPSLRRPDPRHVA